MINPGQRRIKIARDKKGMALIVALLVMSIMVAVTLEFHRNMQAGVISAANASVGIKAMYAAKSGVAFGQALLMGDEPEVDTLQDDWANTEIWKKIAAAASTRSDGARFELEIEDLSGRIPINYLYEPKPVVKQQRNQGSTPQKDIPKDLVKDMFVRLVENVVTDLGLEGINTGGVVGCISDWLDPDSDTRTSTDNAFDFASEIYAEDDYYMALDKPYHCRNGPMASLEELLLVRNMKPELFYGTKEKPGISQYLTVYSSERRININTAPVEVLATLHAGLQANPALPEAMVDYRKEATEDQLTSIDWYTEAISEEITIVPELIKTTSSHFQITSTGYAGNTKRKIVAVAERDSQTNNIRILSWKTY